MASKPVLAQKEGTTLLGIHVMWDKTDERAAYSPHDALLVEKGRQGGIKGARKKGKNNMLEGPAANAARA